MSGDWRCTHGTDRRLHILFRDGGNHLFRVKPLRRHTVWVEPNAHRKTGSVHRCVTHAGNSKKDRLNVPVNVVGNLKTGHLAALRPERHEAKHVLGLGANRAAQLLHFQGKLCLRLRDAVLNLDHVHITVGLNLERKRKVVVAVVGAASDHVEHIVHAIDLILNRHGHGVEHLLRTCARIRIHHLDGRRSQARILGNRQFPDGHHTGKRQHDGDDHGKTRTLDERARERFYLVYRLPNGYLHLFSSRKIAAYYNTYP